MTSSDIAAMEGFEMVVQVAEKEIDEVYCADLLSWAMARAPQGCAWCTVMGNVNAIAVASLADVAVIVLCEGAQLDEEACTKAQEQEINVAKTQLPAFHAAAIIAKSAGLL